MSTEPQYHGKAFIRLALVFLLAGIVFGCVAGSMYLFPEFIKQNLGFQSLRPMHVTSIMFWILLGATGCVYISLSELSKTTISASKVKIQLLLWIIAFCVIMYCYSTGRFGGREYWEFPSSLALFILIAWILFLTSVVKLIRKISTWPVYVWMWLTGSVFFLFIFIENYLWLLPYFRKDLVSDMTIQWKVNGSIVGAWNQLIYGTSFYLLDRINGGNKIGRDRLAFIMYFLGLFNLMFNWGHHIYTLPTMSYVKYIGYAVSMTELVFFIRIVYNWKKTINEHRKHVYQYSYRFIIASEIWAFISLTHAILMSVPALNIYTHGTHVTVAHAMGTTIGINTMILMAAAFMFLRNADSTRPKWFSFVFYLQQISFLIFWLSLNIAGVSRGIWQMRDIRSSFSKMMDNLAPWFIIFFISGLIMSVCIIIYIIYLLRSDKKDMKPLLAV